MSEIVTDDPEVNEPNPGNDEPPKNDDLPKDQPRMVAYDDHQRALSDLQKFKQAKIDLENQLKDMETNSLKGKEEWKKVAEIKEREALDAKEELTGLRKALVSDRKMSAIRNAAIDAGIRKEALDDLDLFPFDDVVVESTSTGRVNVLNADDAVKRLKMTKPYLFGSKKVNVNPGEPGVVEPGKVTYDDLMKAEKKARDTGDYAPYQKLILQYKKQG